jgi:hypothetical protein
MIRKPNSLLRIVHLIVFWHQTINSIAGEKSTWDGYLPTFKDRVKLAINCTEEQLGAPSLVRKPDKENISAALLDGQTDQFAIAGRSGGLGVV